MDFGSIGLLRLASRRLEHLSERQRVVAENIANADTPGYRARDVVPFGEMLAGARPVAPERTDPRHLRGTRPEGGVAAVAERDGWATNPNGNSVSLEQEMAKAADTRETYTMVASVYQKSVAMLRMAVGRGG